MSQQFKIRDKEAGMRLDTFLHEKLENWSHKKIKQSLDKKRVFINGRNILIGKWHLKRGDLVSFVPQQSDFPKNMELSRYHYIDVVFEDDNLLVTNKPAFIDYDTFVAYVTSYLQRSHEKRLGRKFYPYVGQLHRLDKETSGLLVFTKKKQANILADQFRDRRIKKEYMAIVCGKVDKDHGLIRSRLEKGEFAEGQKVRVATEEGVGKISETEYWVVERYEHATLLRVNLHTGRTHQIRVHMESIGHPLIGDKLYGNPENKIKFPIKRQALHARKLEFTHPILEKKMKLEAPVPKDIVALIDWLRLH